MKTSPVADEGVLMKWHIIGYVATIAINIIITIPANLVEALVNLAFMVRNLSVDCTHDFGLRRGNGCNMGVCLLLQFW